MFDRKTPNVRIVSVREFLEGIPTGGDGPIRRVGSKIIMQRYQEKTKVLPEQRKREIDDA